MKTPDNQNSWEAPDSYQQKKEKALDRVVQKTESNEEFSYLETVAMIGGDIHSLIDAFSREVMFAPNDVLTAETFIENKKYFEVKRKELEGNILANEKEIALSEESEPHFVKACQDENQIYRALLVFLNSLITDFETIAQEKIAFKAETHTLIGTWRIRLEECMEQLSLRDPLYRQEKKFFTDDGDAYQEPQNN